MERAQCMPGKCSVRAESTLVNTGDAASMFGSLVHGTVTPHSVFLAAKARDTMDKERETARLPTLVNLNLLEVKNTQLQIQMLNLFDLSEKKREKKIQRQRRSRSCWVRNWLLR